MKKVLFFSAIIFLAFSAQAEIQSHTTEDYIDMWKSTAIEQMQSHKIPASITLAQGILESANGNSKLARHANNHFGIKCHEGWQGGTYYQDDDAANECFRSYTSASESYNDHSLFLTSRKRYEGLFTLSITDYQGWASGLKSAGYATNPKYAQLLVAIIEKYDLEQYDIAVPPIVHEELVVVNDQPITNIGEPFLIPETDNQIDLNKSSHKVYEKKKNVNYIIVHEGDTYYRIAKEFNMGLWQLYKYNDLGTRDVLKQGELVYLAPKSNKSFKGNNILICEREMSLREVSQLEGIKLKKLMSYNFSDKPDEVLPKGTKVILR